MFSVENSHPKQLATSGMDLAKDVFQAHGITADGTVLFNRPIRRKQALAFSSGSQPALSGLKPAVQPVTGLAN